MRLSKPVPKSGVCFAWLPKRTPDGLVWLEHVNFEYDRYGLGGVRYTRYDYSEPEIEDLGKGFAWDEEQARLFEANPTFYSTPPDKAKCRNNDGKGPVPCWHPHCSCMNDIDGSMCR